MIYLWGALADLAGALTLLAQAKKNGNPPLPWWIPFVMIFALFYLMFMRPEKRKRQEHENQLQGLKQNDHVVTIGGIHGVVVNTTRPDAVVIRVDDNTNTRLTISRSAIATVKSEEKEKGTDVEKEK